MKEREVSAIVFYDQKNRILLQDRKSISKCGEEWSFFGGGVENGETPKQAIIREVMEELSYALKTFEFMGTYRFYAPEDTKVTIHFYVASMPDESMLSVREGDGMKLFTCEEASFLKLMPGNKQFIYEIEQFLAKRNGKKSRRSTTS